MSSITCAPTSPRCSTTTPITKRAADKAERSQAAFRKQTTGRTDDGLRGHSKPSSPISTYCRIHTTTALNQKYLFTLHTRPTATQQRA